MEAKNIGKPLQTFTELLPVLERSVKSLVSSDDCNTEGVFDELSFIQKQTRYGDDLGIHRLIIDKIVRSGIGHVFRNDEEGGGRSFRSLQMLLSIVWNCTDSSVSLCESLVLSGSIHHILSELSKPQLTNFDTLSPYNEASVTTRRQTYLLKAYLGILHNISRHCTHSRKVFNSAGALPSLAPLLSLSNDVIKAKAYLLLSYIVSLEERQVINNINNDVSYNNTGLTSNNNTGLTSNNNGASSSTTSPQRADLLAMEDDVTAFIVSILRDALLSHNHFSARYAFWASEIANGINHLAMNDRNKVKLGRLGIFKLYAKMLVSGCHDDERMIASSGLWILSFHPCNKKLISADPALLHTLREEARVGGDEGVSRALRGALWVVRSTGISSAPMSEDAEQDHVMLSYHWSQQSTMVMVRDALVARGYKVWFDVDNMKGSTLEAMALAVERSAVMLLSVCQEYKDSPNCRTEAEYAFRLRKDFIPLLSQRGYSPDGWLGILVGSKLYFDLSADGGGGASDDGELALSDMKIENGLFDLQMERLVREIGERGLRRRGKLKGKVKEDNGQVIGNSSKMDDGGGEQAVVTSGSPFKGTLNMPSAELVSNIIASEATLCQRCAALIANPSPYPTLSLTNTSPECDDEFILQLKCAQQAKLLFSPSPLHGYAPSKNKDTPATSSTQPIHCNIDYNSSNSATFNTAFSTTNSTNEGFKLRMNSWSQEDVRRWIDDSPIAHLSFKFHGYTGANFIQIRKIQKSAPEFLYNYLLNHLKLHMLDILLFSEFLESVK